MKNSAYVFLGALLFLFSAPVVADHLTREATTEADQNDSRCNEISDTPYYSAVLASQSLSNLEPVRLQNAIAKKPKLIVPAKPDFCTSAFASTRNIRELHCRAHKERPRYSSAASDNVEVLERQVSLALSAAELRLNYIRAVACSKTEKAEAFKTEIAKISNPYANEDGKLDHSQGSLAHRAPFSAQRYIGVKRDARDTDPSDYQYASSYNDAETAFFNLLDAYAEVDKLDLQAMLSNYKTNLADRFNHRRAVGISLSGLELPLTTVGQGRAQRDGIGRMRQQSYNNILTALDVVGKMEDALAEREQVDSSIQMKRAILNSALNTARSELILAADWFNTEFYEMVNIVRFQTLAR